MSIRIDGTNTAANPGITGADADTGLQFGTDEVNIVTGGTARAKVDSNGRLLVDTSTARSNFVTGSLASTIQVESGGTPWYSAVKSSNDQFGPFYILGKTRSTTNNGNTVVQSGDELGTLLWQGADGSTLLQGASIAAAIDGTPGTNDLPTRLVFSTTADGASSPTERVRITKEGYLRVHTIPAMYGDNFDWTNTTAKMHAGFIFYDTTSSWNNTTGVYTCPVDGKYLVCADVQGHSTSTQTGASAQFANIVPFKNGSSYGAESVATTRNSNISTGAIDKHDSISFSVVIAASANDTIEVRSNHGYRTGVQNHLTIVYLG